MADKDDIGYNTLVGTLPGDTLENVQSVLAFLQLTKCAAPGVEPSDRQLQGESLILGACMDALEVLAQAQNAARAPRVVA
jgi:hypothetical protein